MDAFQIYENLLPLLFDERPFTKKISRYQTLIIYPCPNIVPIKKLRKYAPKIMSDFNLVNTK